MIASFMAYAIAMGVLLAGAALAIERTLAAFSIARRGIWLVALIASVSVPVIASLNPSTRSFEPARTATSDAVAQPQRAATVRDESATSPREMSRSRSALHWPSWPKLDSLLATLWIAASAALASFYLIGWMRVRRAATSWQMLEIDGRKVLVSDEVGPAVFGFANARVVVPKWVVESPRSLRDLVLEHEFQHLHARDQWCLLVALMAVVIAPWNLALWWQLRRLRLSVEIDCDARVLARGADPISYGETLLSVGRLHLAAPRAAIALTEPRSDLERRIRVFTSAPSPHRLSAAIGSGALCASMIAAAAQLDVPLEQTRLRLPPAHESMTAQVEGAVRAEFPELFVSTNRGPMLVKILFNNDLTIDVAEKRELTPGTTLQAALAPEEANSGFSPAQLHPADPRVVGRLELKQHPNSAPIYVAYTARAIAKSRSAAAVEPVLQAGFPWLYDDATDSERLLIVLMNEDGTVNKAIHRDRTAGQLIGEQNQLRAIAELGVDVDIGTIAVLNGSKRPPFKPVVLYAYPRSDDPSVEALPYSTDAWGRQGTQRELITRYFPDTANGTENAHKLLWILLNADGEVVQTGRNVSGPKALLDDLELFHPGARNAKRLVVPLSGIFGKDMRDTKGQPLLAAFVWLPESVSQPDALPQLSLDAKFYRNDKPVAIQHRSLRFDEANISYPGDELRIDTTAIRISDREVELRMQLQLRVERKNAALADTWETIGNPTVRVPYDADAVIEQGVRYPDATKGPDVWRIVVTPRRL